MYEIELIRIPVLLRYNPQEVLEIIKTTVCPCCMHSIINSKIQTLISQARENLTAFYILYKNIAISLIKKKLNYGAKKWKKKTEICQIVT